MRIHRSALLIDGHNDVPMKTREGFDIGPASATGHTDLPRLKAGGTGAQFFAAYVPARTVEGNRAAHRLFAAIDSIRHDIVGRYPESFQMATTADGILQARRQGKIAALIGIEGGHAIEDDLRILRAAYDLGARYMTLTHTNTNNWADSSGDLGNPAVRHHNGLAPFGREVVREMNRLGMMVDIAHVSDKTFWDVLETSEAPVFSSHSSVRAICGHARNMTDEMIQAMARKGGIVMINFACDFLVDQPSGGKKRATLDDVAAHIDHVKRIAGVGAVGLGSDFDGIDCTPEGLDDVSKWPNLTRKLLEKGYTADEIRQIYGGNLLRVMRAVEKVSAAKKLAAAK